MTSKPAAILAGALLGAALAATPPANARIRPGHDRGNPEPGFPMFVFSPSNEGAKTNKPRPMPPRLLELLRDGAARAAGVAR